MLISLYEQAIYERGIKRKKSLTWVFGGYSHVGFMFQWQRKRQHP